MFSVASEDYDRFMGLYSAPLSTLFADFAGVRAGQTVLDVGCGPGALTHELARRVGEGNVAAIDPTPQFVASCRVRVPGADVQEGAAEKLPWAKAVFDVALSQLVLAFVRDAETVAAEMRRVVRPGGTVAACMWGAGDDHELLSLFWSAVAAVAPGDGVETAVRFRMSGEISDLWARAGLGGIEAAPLDVSASYADFDDLWSTISKAAGSVGAYVARLEPKERDHLRDECRRRLGEPRTSFALRARAWAVRARVVG